MEMAAYVTVQECESPEELIALLSPSAVRLPLGVCITGRLPMKGSDVSIGDGIIAVPGGAWRPVRWWDPRPRIAAADLLDHGGPLLDIVLAEHASSFGFPVPDALTVTAALAGGNATEALDVVGLGPGLTPAADDVVAGALAVLALVGHLDDSVRFAIHARARTHTTALSAALLAAAGRGHMIPQAARVLELLATGEPYDRLSSAARELFRVGSTSGHDLCAGMAGALAAVA